MLETVKKVNCYRKGVLKIWDAKTGKLIARLVEEN
jgi:hypothetical protein